MKETNRRPLTNDDIWFRNKTIKVRNVVVELRPGPEKPAGQEWEYLEDDRIESAICNQVDDLVEIFMESGRVYVWFSPLAENIADTCIKLVENERRTYAT